MSLARCTRMCRSLALFYNVYYKFYSILWLPTSLKHIYAHYIIIAYVDVLLSDFFSKLDSHCTANASANLLQSAACTYLGRLYMESERATKTDNFQILDPRRSRVKTAILENARLHVEAPLQ